MSKEFEKLYREDQKHVKRWAEYYTDREFYRINKGLQIRIKRLLAAKIPEKGKDFFIAAMIFHHGFTLASARKAIIYAKRAVDSGYARGKWLIASATDRLLQLQGKPQKYGTQITEINFGRIRMYRVNSKTSDEERKEYGLPTLAGLRKRLRYGIK